MKREIKYGIISAIITIALFLFITTKLKKCNREDVSNTITEMERSTIKAEIIDSMLSVQAKRDVFVIDSTNNERSKEIQKNKIELSLKDKKLKKYELERNELLASYKKDTTLQTEECNEIIAKDNEVIETQKEVITLLKSDTTLLSLSLNDQKKKYYIELENHNRTLDLYNYSKSKNEELENMLKKNNTWFKRNESWLYFISGSIITTITINSINKWSHQN